MYIRVHIVGTGRRPDVKVGVSYSSYSLETASLTESQILCWGLGWLSSKLRQSWLLPCASRALALGLQVSILFHRTSDVQTQALMLKQ